MISELISSAMHSTPQAFVGVGLICAYFVTMISFIVYRVKKGEHLDH